MLQSPVTVKTKVPVDWQTEHIERIWDYYGSRQHSLSEYFSFQVGPGVVQFLKASGRLNGRVLDYGCGPGFLLEHLLNQQVDCWGADTSEQAVDTVAKKFKGRSNWHGVDLLQGLPTHYNDSRFDVVTCIETLEHLPDGALESVIDEIYRLVAPGGVALFTTPYAEDLSSNVCYCPFCESEFHRVQHMRNFDVTTMTKLLESRGFRTIYCTDLNFASFQENTIPSLGDLSPRSAIRVIKSAVHRFMDRVAPKAFPHARAFRERLIPGGHLAALVTR